MMTTAADYLAQLDEALRDVPHGIAAEIRAGIAEELASLSPDAAAQRIAQLGDPREIAREAMDAGGYTPSAPVAPVFLAPAMPAIVPTTSTRGFAIIAALGLSFGGFIVPLIGWVIGAVLVAMSAMWRTWEKVVAIVIPFAVAAVSALSGMAMWTTSGEASSVSVSGDGAPAQEIANPLVPAWYDMIFSSIWLIGVLLIPASGLWLLWRMRGRTVS